MVVLEVENKADRKSKVKKHLLETLSTLKCVFFIAKVAGMFYLTIDHRGYRLNTTNKRSRLFYTITYLSAYSSICLTALMQSDNNVTKGNLYLVIKYVLNIFCAGNSLLQIITGYFVKLPISRWFNRLAAWDASLETFGLKISNKPLKKLFSGFLFVDTCTFATKTTLFVTAFGKPWSISLSMAIYYVLKSTSKYVLVFTIIHLYLRFKKLNEAIRAINLDCAWDAISIAKFSKSIRKDSPWKLNQLCRFHFKLSHLSKEVNELAAFYFLYAFAVSSGSLLFFSYYLYHNIRTMYLQISDLALTDIMLVLFGIVSLFDEMADCFVITKTCTLVCNAANETPRHLHEVRNRIQSREWDEQIAANSLQFLHQKLVFTAKRYFDINFSVIGSISSTVLTYLVLFIQQDQELLTE